MTRVLLTGLSGVGKSTVIEALAARGYRAVDLDTNAYSVWADASLYADAPGTPVEETRDWVWREDRVEALLSAVHDGPLFVSGTAPNMRKFLPRFDHVILLTAPVETILRRLATRSGNDYGKRPEEAARVVSLIDTVEPLLRKSASHEIDTRAPLGEIVEEVLKAIRE